MVGLTGRVRTASLHHAARGHLVTAVREDDGRRTDTGDSAGEATATREQDDVRLGASSRGTGAAWPGSATPTAVPPTAELGVDALVEVRNRFDDSWTTGFAVTAVRATDCQIRRITDETPLPVWFPLEDVRPCRAA